MSFDEKEFRHESYGIIGWTRMSGSSSRRLFGSSLDKHYSVIRLRIAKGVRRHGLSQDWYNTDGKDYIEIEMSATQFAEFLTSPNMGEGTPCTILRAEGRLMEEPPDERVEVEEVRVGFKEKMEKLGAELREVTAKVEEILSKKSINKGDREEIRRGYKHLLMEIESNAPFVLSQFTEAADKVTQAGKAEVEAFTNHFVHAIGLGTIEDMQKVLKAQAEKRALPEPAGDDDE